MRAPPVLLAQPDLRLWLDLSAQGVIGVRTGKVELGQGILTALAQLAAEEFGVWLGQIQMRAATTLGGPNEGHTVGSFSVEHSGQVMRFLGACMRERLLASAASRMRLMPQQLQVRDGTVWSGEQPSSWSYWTLADELLSDPVAAEVEAPVTAPERCEIAGTAVARVDLAAKLAGGAFIQDLEPPSMRHAKILRKPFADASLAELDTARFQASHPHATCIRNGDFVASVASTEAQAHKALQWLQKHVRWAPANELGSSSSSTSIGTDIAAWLAHQPHIDTVLESHATPTTEASITRQGTWTRPFLAHASIGLCTAVAWLCDGRLDVWTHSQGIFLLRDQIAKVLDRPVDSVALHHMAGAGCYGHNGADDVALDAALVAVAMPGTPVRIEWSRQEELCHAPFGAAMAVHLQATLDSNKKISSWTARVASTSHGTRPGMHGEINLLSAGAVDPRWSPRQVADVPEAIGGGASRNARPIYDVGSRALTVELTKSPVRTSAIRGLGAYANVFAIEGMMDELAAEAHMDAVALRRQHLSDERAIAVLDRVVAMSGWDTHAGADSATTLGLGLAQYKGRAAYCAVVVEIELDTKVSVRRVWCAVDAGWIVNPDGARNQIEGGILQSISWTLQEAVRFDGTTPLCEGWDSYPILRFTDVPVMTTEFVAGTAHPSLGVGEASQGPTAAALGNAVSRALGVRAFRLPLDREQLLELLAPG